MTLGTRDALLQQAEYLIRTRGYAAFSYADLAESSGIRKASVHHHFSTKETLATALVMHYVDRLQTALDTIQNTHATAPARLAAYAQRFADSATGGMLPLCAALAAERDALPESVRARVANFFQLHLAWLAQMVSEGVQAGQLRADVKPDRAAQLLLSALEGGSLVGWALADPAPILSAFQDVLHHLSAVNA